MKAKQIYLTSESDTYSVVCSTMLKAPAGGKIPTQGPAQHKSASIAGTVRRRGAE
ncbi:hypothetical protein J4Q44_G00031770 [Coregonus suidteri]|uniref:Uncharacterized protein n=1 Tax=Coregonus suidteri TaxID=861788 RepID=A0AAN8RH45_9TELE